MYKQCLSQTVAKKKKKEGKEKLSAALLVSIEFDDNRHGTILSNAANNICLRKYWQS
jgi:hypothetical protein